MISAHVEPLTAIVNLVKGSTQNLSELASEAYGDAAEATTS